MNDRPELMPVRLPNGAEMQVEIRQSREHDVSAFQGVSDALTTEGLRDAIEGIADLVKGALDKARPQKIGVEFGLELGYEPGKLTTFLVNGSTKGSLKITLEWSRGE